MVRTHGKTARAISRRGRSAALVVRLGCDLNCGCIYHDLVVAVREGLVTEAEIDTSLRRLPVPNVARVAVEFQIPAETLRLVDAPGCRAWVPGGYTLVVGSASPGPRALALSAPVPATGSVRLI